MLSSNLRLHYSQLKSSFWHVTAQNDGLMNLKSSKICFFGLHLFNLKAFVWCAPYKVSPCWTTDPQVPGSVPSGHPGSSRPCTIYTLGSSRPCTIYTLGSSRPGAIYTLGSIRPCTISGIGSSRHCTKYTLFKSSLHNIHNRFKSSLHSINSMFNLS